MLDDSKIREAFLLLEDARKKMVDFSNITGKHISLRMIEDRYGEYLVADRMIELGWQVSNFGGIVGPHSKERR